MKISARDRILLGVAVVLVLCAAFYLEAIKPEHRKAAQLQTQIAAAQSTLASSQQHEADGHAAELALRRTQADWTTAQHAVPRVSDIPGLLKLLQRSADAAHVSMQSITLTGASASNSATGLPTTTHGATSIPVSLDFTGGYQALNRLVDRLDTLVAVSHGKLSGPGPLVGISQVSIAPASSNADPSALSISLTATIYQRSAASTVLGGGS